MAPHGEIQNRGCQLSKTIGGEKHMLALSPYDELAKRSKDHSRLYSGRTGTTIKRLDTLIKRFLE